MQQLVNNVLYCTNANLPLIWSSRETRVETKFSKPKKQAFGAHAVTDSHWAKRGRKAFGLVLLMTAMSPLLATMAAAQSMVALPRQDEHGPRWSLSSNGELSGNAWSGHSTFGYSLLAPLDEEGPRIRVGGGAGRYTYDGAIIVAPAIGPDRAPKTASVTFNGTASLLEILVGQQWRVENWTTKVFAGYQWSDHTLLPDDANNQIRGSDTGVKVLWENWLDLSPSLWAQLDVGYAEPFESYQATGRVGWKVFDPFAIGLELRGLGNRIYDRARAGAFVAFPVLNQDVRVSGGYAADFDAELRRFSDEYGLYATINTYSQF